VPDSRDSIGFLVADVARLMRRAFQARLEGGPITYAQARALVNIASREGMRQVDLADLLETQPITVARLVDQLGAAGLVERRADPADRRAYRLHLTPAARPRLAEIRAVSEAVQRQALADLSPAGATRTTEGLRRMRETLSGPRRGTRRAPPTD
jgi:DNA-binding MarR family transcriptional regulator